MKYYSTNLSIYDVLNEKVKSSDIEKAVQIIAAQKPLGLPDPNPARTMIAQASKTTIVLGMDDKQPGMVQILMDPDVVKFFMLQDYSRLDLKQESSNGYQSISLQDLKTYENQNEATVAVTLPKEANTLLILKTLNDICEKYPDKKGLGFFGAFKQKLGGGDLKAERELWGEIKAILNKQGTTADDKFKAIGKLADGVYTDRDSKWTASAKEVAKIFFNKDFNIMRDELEKYDKPAAGASATASSNAPRPPGSS